MIQNIVLVDHAERDHLLPLTYTRPMAKIRVGIFTIDEKWKNLTDANVSFKTRNYLANVFPSHFSESNYYINGGIIPTNELISAIDALIEGQSLMAGNTWIATKSKEQLADMVLANQIPFEGDLHLIDRTWKIFQWNGWALDQDFNWIKSQRTSQPIPAGVTVIGDNVFLEKGAVVQPSAILNSTDGPIYIGTDAEVMEGSMIRGGFALCEHSAVKMGAKIYGPTTVGPYSKVGGEVGNSVIFGYSNKGHDGYIGNTVIGEWCNLGADTNTSNLKNNYSIVKVHNFALNRSESTGSQFCGLTMGDHSKSGINTMFNTGTMCGIFANVFGSDFPHRNIPSFGWGGAAGFKSFRL
ncbi:MAG: putative sugar nucleotidyl transferase, partial [Salibacteraceae bacterium]|nr:putative sugar nucleotidyl transferase [Salibacteraceae bacterium]